MTLSQGKVYYHIEQIFTFLFQSSSHSILLLESSRYEEIANVSEDEDGKEGVAKVMEDGTVPPILRL